MEIGFLLLRLAVGLTLAAHGAQKLFGWFGGPGLDGVGAFFEQLGFVPGRRNAWLAGAGEFGGGVLLALGLLTPFAAAVIAGVMLVAVFSMHLKNGFFMTAGGYEYNLVLGAAAISLAFTGPGALSADALAGLPLSGYSWGLFAVVAGLAGGTLSLAGRHQAAPAVSK